MRTQAPTGFDLGVVLAITLLLVQASYADVNLLNIDFNEAGFEGGSSPTFSGFELLDPAAPLIDRSSNTADSPLSNFWNGVIPTTDPQILLLSDGATLSGVRLYFSPVPAILNAVTANTPTNATALMQDSLQALTSPQTVNMAGLIPESKYLLFLYGSGESQDAGTTFTVGGIEAGNVSDTTGSNPTTTTLTIKEDYVVRTAFADADGVIQIAYGSASGYGAFNGMQLVGDFPALPAQKLLGEQVPDQPTNTDGTEYELGMKFQTRSSGEVLAIRYWNSEFEHGSHRGSIWRWSDGSLLAIVNSPSISDAEGWIELPLAKPLNIGPGEIYVVSVNARSYFPVTRNQFEQPIMTQDLASIADGNNGVYGKPFQMPRQSYTNSNYYRDIVFVADGIE